MTSLWMATRAAGRTARYIWGHPLGSRNRRAAFERWIRWQVAIRLAQGAMIVPFVHPARLAVKAGMMGATGNVYLGLHEFEDMALVMHALHEGDLFLDVG